MPFVENTPESLRALLLSIYVSGVVLPGVEVAQEGGGADALLDAILAAAEGRSFELPHRIPTRLRQEALKD